MSTISDELVEVVARALSRVHAERYNRKYAHGAAAVSGDLDACGDKGREELLEEARAAIEAAGVEGLRSAGKHLLDMIDVQRRGATPSPKRESHDDANSRDERDQVFGDAVERFRAALEQGR